MATAVLSLFPLHPFIYPHTCQTVPLTGSAKLCLEASMWFCWWQKKKKKKSPNKV